MIVVVCTVIAERNGKFLLVREDKPEAKGKYGLPGGRLEHGETLLDCARRELQEETGYTADDLKLVSITHKPKTHKQNSVVRFVYRATGFSRINQSSELHASWIDKDEIRSLSQDERIRGSDVLDLLDAGGEDLTVTTY